MGTRATLVRLGLLAAEEPACTASVPAGAGDPGPARHRPVGAGSRGDAGRGADCGVGSSATPRPPLTPQRLRLRADLAYALAAVDGRRRVAAEDLAAADRLALRLLDRWSGTAGPAPGARRQAPDAG